MSGFTPENDLERALVAAAEDAARVPDFYRALLESHLLVIDESPGPVRTGWHEAEAGTQLRIRPVEVDGVPHVPVFSSTTRIETFAQEPAHFVGLPARDLFEMLAGSHVVLNPGADYGKQLVPDEIQALVDGSMFSSHSPYAAEEETPVLMGQPAEVPHHVTEALGRFFAIRENVRAAYLALYHDPARHERPVVLVGIDAAGDWDALVGEASLVLRRVTRRDDAVELVRIGDSDVSRYMVEETEPFFRR